MEHVGLYNLLYILTCVLFFFNLLYRKTASMIGHKKFKQNTEYCQRFPATLPQVLVAVCLRKEGEVVNEQCIKKLLYCTCKINHKKGN